mgnify:CR=1 FL=1
MSKGRHPNHGGRKPSPTYNSWRSMVQRCTNPNHTHYERYKDLLCEDWLDFNNFLQDMGERLEGTSLDRINNDKGYYKENCRWATAEQQVRNRSNSVMNQSIASEILNLYNKGLRTTEISNLLNISKNNVSNVIHKGYWR